MTTATNPLLIALRASPIKLPKHIRIYTTVYKAGGYRVKLYGTRHVPAGLRRQLALRGFFDIRADVFNGAGYHYAPSVTIRAKD